MADRSTVRVTQTQMEEQRQWMAQVRAMENRPQTYHIITYGCQMNAHDSEKLAGMLEEMGLRCAPTREEADAVLVVAKPSAENELSLIDNNFFME